MPDSVDIQEDTSVPKRSRFGDAVVASPTETAPTRKSRFGDAAVTPQEAAAPDSSAPPAKAKGEGEASPRAQALKDTVGHMDKTTVVTDKASADALPNNKDVVAATPEIIAAIKKAA